MLEDWPVRIRRNQSLDLNLGARFKEAKYEPHLAQMVKLSTLAGGGDSAEEARADLAEAFHATKAERLKRGNPLRRQGTAGAVEFRGGG
jgi:hypothetical protein